MADSPNISPPKKGETFVIRVMVLLGMISIVNFLYWFLQEEYRAYAPIYWILVLTLVYGILRMFYMWYHYIGISVPPTPDTDQVFSVDILTTYFPGEPYEMIEETLQAIQKITYPHTTYLCDEANDPHLREFCRKLGVIHVSRDNRKDAKAGNINNALRQATGEICVVLDPDHVPEPNFLDPIIPHFSNPGIGFVQIVQSYYNLRESLVARGAAEQTFQFYGPMMMSMNSYGTVNAIGANCTFRRAALDSIGGHAPGLSEDMHTAMRLHARGWKSVYVPEVLARGLAPSDLTSFYKQQLKWSRGTFDLLFYVYPGLFRKFSLRQKIHYALLPLHFLIGLICFLNFIIPILSLTLAKIPWQGNILFFIAIVFPMVMSAFLIRTYIQKWVIEKSERGFHIVGGLLQITTWWIYLLGFVYTIFKKKVPYLPTPKNGAEHSNFRIIIPNIILGLVSLFAIFYGLSIDFTPFSVVMALFALLNAVFMFFSVYLATRKTNKNQILRTSLSEQTIAQLVKVKHWYKKLADYLFRIIRPLSLPLLLVVIGLSFFIQTRYQRSKWENVQKVKQKEPGLGYLGIFYPTENDGVSDLKKIRELEAQQNLHFDLVSYYIPWGEYEKDPLSGIYDRPGGENRIPLVTWEPWAGNFAIADSLSLLKDEKKVFRYISEGVFDEYITGFARRMDSIKSPVFLRFAHEFDNPAYPWSAIGGNSAEEFINAWKHVHGIFKKVGADNVVWVWNPWRAHSMDTYYPGDYYVDWIGITGLNYGTLSDQGQWTTFSELYRPFQTTLKQIADKPVMISEFGSQKKGGSQWLWLKDAFTSISKDFPEIRGIVFFESDQDTNLPDGTSFEGHRLDWTIDSLPDIPKLFRDPVPSYLFDKPGSVYSRKLPVAASGIEIPPFRAVKYKKGQNWGKSNYVLSRNVLLDDFRAIKSLGFNTIRYRGSRIYDHNVLKYSSREGLMVVYSFWVPQEINFVTSVRARDNVEKEILRLVRKHRSKEHIIAWNLGNDVWTDLQTQYNEPALSLQRAAYNQWLYQLMQKIKQIDPGRPLLLDMELNRASLKRMREYKAANLPLDAYGLIVKDSIYLRPFLDIARKESIPYVISDIDQRGYTALVKKDLNHGITCRNWQDQWESDLISFDGLVDFEGRPRPEFHLLANEVNGNTGNPDSIAIRIVKPANLLYPGNLKTYNLAIAKDGEWKYPEKDSLKGEVFWYLIKNDTNGNRLAIKELGTGTFMQLRIPPNLENFEIMAVYSGNNIAYSNITSLNTPLKLPRPSPQQDTAEFEKQ